MGKKSIQFNPKLFGCPRCRQITIIVTISMKENKAEITCTNCLLRRTYTDGICSLTEPVDVYGMLIDEEGKRIAQ